MAMSDVNSSTSRPLSARAYRTIEAAGAPLIHALSYVGGMALLLATVMGWVIRGAILRKVRFGSDALFMQIVRVGVQSISIIALVSVCIGLILVLQMAPTLDEYGQLDKVANVNAVALLRELGPLISAIVITGFAGASIAAELGTMVVGEEIEALETMALNPVRFLVVPRVLATVIGLVLLTAIADLVALASGAAIGVFVLEIPWNVYLSNTLEEAGLADFLTGLAKAAVFGLLIGLIACYNGLKVTGGAAGVGNATTMTVVHAIVSIIVADLLFTALFFIIGLT
jgi:phospholipid/cholesterol/gamma-HCH transport system permease protein